MTGMAIGTCGSLVDDKKSDAAVKRVILFLNQKKVQRAARFILGGVFIYASLDKIAFPREFANIVIRYRILPEKLACLRGFEPPTYGSGVRRSIR